MVQWLRIFCRWIIHFIVFIPYILCIFKESCTVKMNLLFNSIFRAFLLLLSICVFCHKCIYPITEWSARINVWHGQGDLAWIRQFGQSLTKLHVRFLSIYIIWTYDISYLRVTVIYWIVQIKVHCGWSAKFNMSTLHFGVLMRHLIRLQFLASLK